MRIVCQDIAAASLGLLALACFTQSCPAAAEHSFVYQLERGADRNGKPQQPLEVKGWLPATDYIRGVVCSDNIILGPRLAKSKAVRAVAQELGLAIVSPAPLSFNGKETFDNMDKMLNAWAEASGHTELKGAPLITIGHSTGGILVRNVIYADPSRVICVVHIMSGNLQQHITSSGAGPTLAGVPFLAVNGEMEAAYPESGMDPRFGNQTQWVMVRESLIERRMKDPAHLMNLLVLPDGGHTSWSDDLTTVCALFIKKAVQNRTPGTPSDPKTSSKCLTIKPESGWLTDANIKAPQFNPAPYDKYEGDSDRTFWHFDEEMALATTKFHEGKFKRPDPLWGPLDVEAVRAFNLRRTDGPDAAVKALLPLCDAADQHRRAEAAGYMGRLGPAASPSIPKLVAMFGENPTPTLVDSLSLALARLSSASTEPLLAATRHADANVRAGAVQTLGRIGQPADKILQVIEGAVADKEPAVRRAAFGAMVAMKADPSRIGAAAAVALDDLARPGHELAFSNACNAIIGLGTNVLAVAAPALIRALASTDATVFSSATAGILAVKPKPPVEAIPALSAAILTADTNRWLIAVSAVTRIDKSGETNLVLACIGQLRNKDAVLADLAADLITRLAPKAGTPEFRRRTVKTLLDILEGKSDSPVRCRAARAIGAFGTDAKEAVPALKMALEEPGLKVAAQKALTDIGASGGPNLEAEMQ